MSRELFGVELGLRILSQNSMTGVCVLQGSAAPGGSGGFDDTAEVGSIYLRTNGTIYQKITSGTGSDKWIRLANANDLLNLHWRGDKVTALTSTAAPAEDGTIDLSSVHLGGDETPFLGASDFAVGDCILFGYGGTEKIARITDITGDVLTFTLDPLDANYPVAALATNDAFLVKYYLPDSPDSQEATALVIYNGTDYVKIADVNWDLATGINLSSSYAAATGNPAPGDSVEAAIQKLDGNLDALTSAVGIAQGASNMGAYTNSFLTANQSVKTNIQEISDAIGLQPHAEGITTEASVDELLVDIYQAAEWFLTATLDSNPAQRQTMSVAAHHDGTTLADASNIDDTVYSKLKVGTAFNLTVKVDLNGTGATQKMRLRIAATAAVSVKVVRKAAIKF
jgi:hypothetical protein